MSFRDARGYVPQPRPPQLSRPVSPPRQTEFRSYAASREGCFGVMNVSYIFMKSRPQSSVPSSLQIKFGETPAQWCGSSTITIHWRYHDLMLWLPRRDGDFDRGIWPDMVAVTSIMLRVPMPNPSPNLIEKIKTSLLGQVSEIAD